MLFLTYFRTYVTFAGYLYNNSSRAIKSKYKFLVRKIIQINVVDNYLLFLT